MADKEERIEISIYDLNNKEWNGDIPIDIHKVYTRPEAIEVMAKAIRNWEFPYSSPRQIGWEDLSEDTKDDYKNMAQSALNALLEGGIIWRRKNRLKNK